MVDVFSHNAAAIVATMRSGRNGLYFGKEEVQENVRFHLASKVQPRKAQEGKNKPGSSTRNSQTALEFFIDAGGTKGEYIRVVCLINHYRLKYANHFDRNFV